MTSNVDPVILDCFVKEVEGYLPLLAQHLEEYQLDPSRTGSLAEAHRMVHSIKGAGATVGLMQLSRLAQYTEDALEQVLSGEIPWSGEAFGAFGGAVERIAAYLDRLLRGELPDRELLAGVVTRFRRLRSLPEEGDAAEVERLLEEDPAGQVSPELPEPALLPDPAEADGAVALECEPGCTADGCSDGVMQTLDVPTADEGLWEAFQQEAAEHFEKMAAALEELSRGAAAEPLRTLRRSVHQLKGASGMVGLRKTSALNASMQKVLDHVLEGAWQWSEHLLPPFQAAFDVVLEAVGGHGAGLRLADRAAQLEEEFTRLLAGGAPKPAAAPDLAPPEPAGRVGALETAGASAAVQDRVDAGEDLWDAFHQETDELLHQIGDMLRKLERQTPDAALIQALRRAVHTVKGAFGVVGMRQTSAIAHRMEDLLDALYDGRVVYQQTHSPLLFATHDLLVDALAHRGLRAESQAAATAILAEYGQLLAQTAEAGTQEEAGPAAETLPAGLELFRRPAEAAAAAGNVETHDKGPQFVRVPLERVDDLVRLVSELVIHRSRFEQYLATYVREIDELQLTIERLNRVSRRLQSDYEAVALQEANRRMSFALAGGGRPLTAGLGGSAGDWDALEFDRYTEFHLLSRDLAETTGDITNLGARLSDLIADFDGYRNRLGVITSDVEDRLTKLRMLPLRNLSQRLHRTVRVTAERRDKRVDFHLDGETTELDKTLLEEMAGPLDHILRNAVDHGIEAPQQRLAEGKPERGLITLRAWHEGTQVVLQIKDDGRGLDLEKLRAKAVETGYASAEEVPSLSDQELYSLIFLPGLSTAEELSEVSGRGVGLDVVKSTVSRMKGTLSVSSEKGAGTTFTIRLPLSMSLTRVLLVKSADETYAIPVASVSQILRVEPEQMERVGRKLVLRLAGKIVPTAFLAEVLGQPLPPPVNLTRLKAVILNVGDQRLALMVDAVVEAREAVVKSLGPLTGQVHGVTGATILGDGSVVLILNPNDLLHQKQSGQTQSRMRAAVRAADQAVQVLIVDDSPTVRRVLTNTVRNAGWAPHTAKDGLDALDLIHNGAVRPEVVLLDIEMPRMDGFELTASLRAMPQHRNTPIVMLTSRAGDKHRKRAMELGANAYMIKPYQDEELLGTIRRVLAEAKGAFRI